MKNLEVACVATRKDGLQHPPVISGGWKESITAQAWVLRKHYDIAATRYEIRRMLILDNGNLVVFA
jgi:hypothetical protein